MNWPEISAAITALVALYGALRRIVKLQASSIRTIVKSECRSLAIDIENLEDRIKHIDSRLDSVMKTIGELKAHQTSTRTALDRVHDETWKLMVQKPELFSAEGLVVDKAAGGYALGDALDSDLKVQTWAQARIDEAEAYGVARAKRIKQFADEKAAILGS